MNEFTRLSKYISTLVLLALTAPSWAADFFAPPSGKGPAVILLSGASGLQPYRWYAVDVAKLGYTAVLVAGKDVSIHEKDSAENLRKTIEEANADSRVLRGKVVVIGFSLGGGGALAHAALLKEAVAGVIAYYPNITRSTFDARDAGARIAVPTLILAGEMDTYRNCCLIESMRKFEAGALSTNATFELVAYPNANHGFNLDGSFYRSDVTGDAWERTKAFLEKFHPLK